MGFDHKADWLNEFEVWMAARFEAEFGGEAWIHHFDVATLEVWAAPRGSASQSRIVAALPADALNRPPYLIAAFVAAEIRRKAEEAGMAPRKRTSAPARLDPPQLPDAEPPATDA